MRNSPAGPGTAARSDRTMISLVPVLPSAVRETDERDDRLHEHERDAERERTRVAETVGGAQPL